MRLVTVGIGVVAIAAVGFLASQALMHPVGNKTAAAPVASVMPEGITFQIVGAQTAMSAMGAFRGYPVITDEKHRTIYTSDADGPDKSNCTGDCAKQWQPLAAPADAKPSGFWGVTTRADGSKQWTRHGKPLYTFADDKRGGDMKGTKVEGWHFVLNNAMGGVTLPEGIVTEEMVAAGGQAFVDPKQRTIYAFSGDIKDDKIKCAPGATCEYHFLPLLAPELATKLGDFTAISRPDGTRQWAYQGEPLYTYDGDAEHGDSKGRAVDPRFHVALAEKYFQPANIRFGINHRGRDYLTDAKGMTVYARDRFHFQVGGFSLKGGQAGVPLLGEFLLNTRTCVDDCLKTYTPLWAPAGAKPSGYWSIMKRKEGTQWAYMGYALYTYKGDQKPGDETSQDDFDISMGKVLPPIPQNPIDAVSALYWREVQP